MPNWKTGLCTWFTNSQSLDPDHGNPGRFKDCSSLSLTVKRELGSMVVPDLLKVQVYLFLHYHEVKDKFVCLCDALAATDPPTV
eukprot:CAMPEP_0203780072 /NCGR_PEP_ID=MMETSP0099_2-20121227/9163_1 /ASSEMBLY_ACC=CAM_ASM_000209 /TAXON_ID=96639 /ORGANISM=" , Strain NY0313808BC1" /LENGTH=83 /DNA_ID=CAMNT_0050680279 /DNA_START=32 /DNA_END=280 /DNA_ORIENTATION=-